MLPEYKKVETIFLTHYCKMFRIRHWLWIFLLMPIALVNQGCVSTMYINELEAGPTKLQSRQIYFIPVQYRLYTDERNYVKAYNPTVYRTGVVYTAKAGNDTFRELPLDEIIMITYNKRLPGAFIGGVSALMLGNLAINVSDERSFRASEDIASANSIKLAAFGVMVGSMVGSNEVIYLNPYYKDRYQKRRRGKKVDWVID